MIKSASDDDGKEEKKREDSSAFEKSHLKSIEDFEESGTFEEAESLSISSEGDRKISKKAIRNVKSADDDLVRANKQLQSSNIESMEFADDDLRVYNDLKSSCMKCSIL
jgi:hypothetical protein